MKSGHWLFGLGLAAMVGAGLPDTARAMELRHDGLGAIWQSLSGDGSTLVSVVYRASHLVPGSGQVRVWTLADGKTLDVSAVRTTKIRPSSR